MRTPESVVHGVLGPGTVVASINHGMYLQVAFDAGTRWVPRSEVGFEVDGVRVLPASRRPLPAAGHARRLVEAMRMGTVPKGHVQSFTFGREDAIASVRDALEGSSQGRGAALMVEEGYGSGKTHFLEFVARSALDEGWAVASVELDPKEVTPFRVRRIHQAITSSLVFRRGDVTGGLPELLALDPSPLARPHRFLDRALAMVRAEGVTERLTSWLGGERIHDAQGRGRLPVFVSDYVAANSYSYVHTGIAHLARRAGLRGLLVVFDEAESLMDLSEPLWQLKGTNVMTGLVKVATGAVTPETEDLTDLVPRETRGQTLLVGRKSGLIYSRRRHDPDPYVYDPGPDGPRPVLGVLFAFTPSTSPLYDGLVRIVGHDRRIRLPMFGPEPRRQLARALLDKYEQGYGPIGLDGAAFDELVSLFEERFSISPIGLNLRFYLKALVELFDLKRHFPERSPGLLVRREWQR